MCVCMCVWFHVWLFSVCLDVAPKVAATPTPAPAAPKADAVPAAASTSGQAMSFTGYPRPERRVKMNRMRSRIAERLKESQNTAASLTTFNECDMRYQPLPRPHPSPFMRVSTCVPRPQPIDPTPRHLQGCHFKKA